MMKILSKIILGILLLSSGSLSAQKITCHLKGEVIDRENSNTLYLLPKGGDARVSSIEIPIVDGKFDYLLDCEYVENYELSFKDEIMKGAWRPIYFIAEEGVVNFTLYPMERHLENKVEGGKMNQAQDDYLKLLNTNFDWNVLENKRTQLVNNGKYYTERAMELRRQLENAKSKNEKDSLGNIVNELGNKKENVLTSEALALEKEMRQWFVDRNKWQLDYVAKNISLISYGVLVDIITADKRTRLYTERCLQIFEEIYKDKYKDHPYTSKIENDMLAILQVRVGGKFVDFENPDFDGNLVKLSEYVDGEKIILLDLWASWCGPCRRFSKSVIPVYEEYKDKGFMVLGVAREAKAEDAINAAKKDAYPWLSLLEVADQNKIWAKYGIGNSGGATFLIDKDGAILAISPSLDELKEILDKKLN